MDAGAWEAGHALSLTVEFVHDGVDIGHAALGIGRQHAIEEAQPSETGTNLAERRSVEQSRGSCPFQNCVHQSRGEYLADRGYGIDLRCLVRACAEG